MCKSCEDCNYYTEEFDIDKNDNVPFCIKGNEIKENNCCEEYNDDIICYDCPERYERFYEIDDIDHYCRKYNCLIFAQQRSVLYKGDFIKNKINKCDKLKNI